MTKIYRILSLAAWMLPLAAGMPLGAGAAEVALPEGDFVVDVHIVNNAMEAGRESRQKARQENPGAPVAPMPEEPKRPRLTGIEVTRYQDTMIYRLEWTKGVQTEVWMPKGKRMVGSHPNGSVYVGRDYLLALPVQAQMTSRAVRWMTPKYRKGSQDYKMKGFVAEGEPRKKKDCLFYERLITYPDKTTALFKAWLDPETRLPVAMSDGTYTYEFTYTDRVPASPTMPVALRRELERYEKKITRPNYL